LAEDDIPANNIAHSPCSAFISAMAVSMVLELRSTLLASPNATTCLQRLLNFLGNTDVRRFIKNAMSLQPLYSQMKDRRNKDRGALNMMKSPLSSHIATSRYNDHPDISNKQGRSSSSLRSTST
jgi:hypothetical protein